MVYYCVTMRAFIWCLVETDVFSRRLFDSVLKSLNIVSRKVPTRPKSNLHEKCGAMWSDKSIKRKYEISIIEKLFQSYQVCIAHTSDINLPSRIDTIVSEAGYET